MTTNLFVVANVKQLRTYIVLEFYCLFFQTSWGVGVLNSAFFNSFNNLVEFGTILEGFGISGGGLNPTTPPLVTPLDPLVTCTRMERHRSAASKRGCPPWTTFWWVLGARIAWKSVLYYARCSSAVFLSSWCTFCSFADDLVLNVIYQCEEHQVWLTTYK